jgi:dTDP-4-amino-4,6-dideoxygalactose transaminase
MDRCLNSQEIDLGFIPYCEHSISEEEIREVVDTLNSNWITKGPKTIEFEEKISEYIGCKYTIAVSSCTAALHLALRISEIEPEDEIITTPMTFCATAEVIEYMHAKPVFVDIDPCSFNIDVNRIEEKISSRTRAILPVHYGGIPCELNTIYNLADAYDIEVIEDAAHALGTTYEGKKIGNFGRLTAFSFYPTKNMTTCEGGALTTDDPEIAEELKILSLHGISKDSWKRYTNQGNWYYEVTHLGYKYNFTDVQAALGLQQLKKLDIFNNVREGYAKFYFDEILTIPEIEMPDWYSRYFKNLQIEGVKCSWHLFVIMLNNNRLKIGRDQFIEELKSYGIGTSVHFIPLHFHPYYAIKYGYKRGDFKEVETVYNNIISLPLYPKLNHDHLQYIVDSIRQIVKKYRI